MLAYRLRRWHSNKTIVNCLRRRHSIESKSGQCILLKLATDTNVVGLHLTKNRNNWRNTELIAYSETP